MYRALSALVAAVLMAVAVARLAYDARTSPDHPPAQSPWAQHRMAFVTWNDEKWTAWIRDGLFEHRPVNTQRWSRHANPSLAYLDWEGRPWQAKLDDEVFLLAYRGDWNGPVTRAEAIRYRDWEGRKALRTVAQLRR